MRQNRLFFSMPVQESDSAATASTDQDIDFLSPMIAISAF
jgi:hypothetical protein